jgi:hypothetical protein
MVTGCEKRANRIPPSPLNLHILLFEGVYRRIQSLRQKAARVFGNVLGRAATQAHPDPIAKLVKTRRNSLLCKEITLQTPPARTCRTFILEEGGEGRYNENPRKEHFF